MSRKARPATQSIAQDRTSVHAVEQVVDAHASRVKDEIVEMTNMVP